MIPNEIWLMIFRLMYDNLIRDIRKREFQELRVKLYGIIDEMIGLTRWLNKYSHNLEDCSRMRDAVKDVRANINTESLNKLRVSYYNQVKILKDMSWKYKVKMCDTCHDWYKVQHKCKG